MMKVALIGAEFFARHGHYPEEQILGNRFMLDIEAEFVPHLTEVDDQLERTLNYEQLYVIAAKQMKVTRQLLETVVQGIVDQIIDEYDFVNRLTVTLKKIHPPMKGVAASAVTLVYERPVSS